MSQSKSRNHVGVLVGFSLAILLDLYFAFAVIEGDFGIFRQFEVDAHNIELRKELVEIQGEVDRMRNLTNRLSDDYLDLDLLDERARIVLGVMRSDEAFIIPEKYQ